MSDVILLIRGARLKHDDKTIFPSAEMTVWTVMIRKDFDQCYIFVMFTGISVTVL